jgi:transcription-repair coupling factor (superfamily II helicase)
MRLLEDAVKELRQEKVTEPTDTYVDLSIEALLPDEYVGDPALKLGFYRRIAAASSEEGLSALADELTDRCGPLPESARRLFDVARLRIIGQDHGIARFGMESGGVLQMAISDPGRALPFLRRKLKGSLRLPERNIAIVGEPMRPARSMTALATYLQLLGE